MRTRTPDAPADEEGRWLRRMFLTVATVTAVLALLIFLWYAVEVLLIIFAGILLAVVLRSLADLLAQHAGIWRCWASAAGISRRRSWSRARNWRLPSPKRSIRSKPGSKRKAGASAFWSNARRRMMC